LTGLRERLHPTVLLMAGAHFMVDGYGNIYAPLLPLLIPRLGLSLAAAGTLTMLYQIAASVSQVGFGRLADSWRPRVLVMAGPVLAVAVLSLIGLASSKPMLALILFAGGLGGAAFHPPAAALAHRLGGTRPGLAMSVHITGGTLGFSLGPLLFAPFAERLFNALKDKAGKKIIGFVWAGAHPMAKFVDMKPDRFGIELAPGGNILPVMNAWKQFAGTEGGIYYYYDFPKNPMNDWLKAEYQKRYGAPPDFFVAGGFAAAAAVVAALKQAGSSDSEKLIAAMEDLTFATPKGPMTFRKEDHQALQDMYHFRIKKDAKDNDVLELVDTIAAKEMPLPVRTKR